MSASEKDYIERYRQLVEEKLMLGTEGSRLKQRDFEYLSTVIEEKSKVKLSVSTLKRLWKSEYTQVPHPTTLDALVSVLDFANWPDFKKAQAENIRESEKPAPVVRKVVPASVYIIVGFLVITTTVLALQAFNRSKKTEPVKIPFTADKTVTSGVPNTVMFTYDFRNVHADSFFIQQSWNPRNKTAIDPAKHYFSAIYYEPGFHWARLIADDSIVTFASVHIKTDGWLPLVKYDLRDRVPIYLDTEAMLNNGALQITNETLQRAGVDLSKEFYTRLYNIRDFSDTHSDNFDLETRMRCEASPGLKAACPKMEVMMVMEEDVFRVPLTIPGCVNELRLNMGENFQSGVDTNLSKLGTNVYDWQTLRVQTLNKKTIISLNGEPVHELSFVKNFGKLVGLIITFRGTGSVDYVHLNNGQGERVYADEFEPVVP